MLLNEYFQRVDNNFFMWSDLLDSHHLVSVLFDCGLI